MSRVNAWARNATTTHADYQANSTFGGAALLDMYASVCICIIYRAWTLSDHFDQDRPLAKQTKPKQAPHTERQIQSVE